MDRTRLGARLRRRRIALGLSVSRAAREAGISRGTWIAVEDGSRETESYNFGPIERVLDWAEGTIDSMLAEDGEPAAVDATLARYNEAVETLRDIADAVRSKYSDKTVRAAVLDLIEYWERSLTEAPPDLPAERDQRLEAG